MNNLELHYFLEDNSHSMDAVIKNRSEAELYKLIFEISHLIEIDIKVEIEALKQGGIKDVFKFFSKKKNKRYVIYLGAIISGVLINVLSSHISEDKELTELTKEEKKLNIKLLTKQLENESIPQKEENQIVENLIILINDTQKIKFFKSRFYQQIIKEPKLYQISAVELYQDYSLASEEKVIDRNMFELQILENNDFEPISIEDAYIQIISPVLNNNNIKWKGVYNNKPISFTLLDNEFKNEVLNKEHSFSNGTSIKCRLEIIKILDDLGTEVIKDARVFDVLEIFNDHQTKMTKKAKILKIQKHQLKLDL
ncbi:hypothetical protein ACFX5U_12550 [Sphingobacterium sp. SG20118]|uniref:hypothetical protein n=1 Tax=Sphingobacterium sp. SG20118 TaxID=3367156 RepID=UPI0037DFC4AD